jgi:hypothetical protein
MIHSSQHSSPSYYSILLSLPLGLVCKRRNPQDAHLSDGRCRLHPSSARQRSSRPLQGPLHANAREVRRRKLPPARRGQQTRVLRKGTEAVNDMQSVIDAISCCMGVVLLLVWALNQRARGLWFDSPTDHNFPLSYYSFLYSHLYSLSLSLSYTLSLSLSSPLSLLSYHLLNPISEGEAQSQCTTYSGVELSNYYTYIQNHFLILSPDQREAH